MDNDNIRLMYIIILTEKKLYYNPNLKKKNILGISPILCIDQFGLTAGQCKGGVGKKVKNRSPAYDVWGKNVINRRPIYDVCPPPPKKNVTFLFKKKHHIFGDQNITKIHIWPCYGDIGVQNV